MGPATRAEIAGLLYLPSMLSFSLMTEEGRPFQALQAQADSGLLDEQLKDQAGQRRRQQQSQQKQPGLQVAHAVAKQEEQQHQQMASLQAELQHTLQRCKSYCWVGLLTFECAVSFVFTLAFAPAMFSFECLADQRVGLGLAAGMAPPFQDQLLGLLQGRSAVQAGGGGESGRAADEHMQTTALAGGNRVSAVPKGEAAGEGRVEENAGSAA
jgi:hypothetical protein